MTKKYHYTTASFCAFEELYDGGGADPILWILYKIEMFDYLQTYYGCSISVVDQNFHTLYYSYNPEGKNCKWFFCIIIDY